MGCRYTYQGKTYEAFEFDDVLKALPVSVAAKYMDGVKSIPEAPFIGKDPKPILDLALKRMIAYAVENGYDKVAFVNGEQSADRYSLAKKVSRLEWKSNPGESTGVLIGWDRNGNGILEKEMAPSEAEDHIGKELADRLINGPVNHETARGRQVRRLEGVDLKVGGEGMKTFYDQIVPQRIREVLKKVGGGKVETVQIKDAARGSTPSGADARWVIEVNGKEWNAYSAEDTAREDLADLLAKGKSATLIDTAQNTLPQIGFTITPEMREKVGQGLPLFSPVRQATWQPTATGRLDKWIYEGQDKLIDLKRVRDAIAESGIAIREQYNGYLAEELFHGRAAYRVQSSFENEFLPLLEEMKMRGIKVEDFDKFLHARHAEERNAAMLKANPNQAELDQLIADTSDALLRASGQDAIRLDAKLKSLLATQPYSGTEDERAMLSGMSDAEARTYLASLGTQRNSYDALGKRIDDLVEETRLLMEVYGLETAETVDALRNAYKHYVPLMREMDESDLLGTGGSGVGAGYSVRGSTLKQATGSLRKVESIFANLMAQREQVIVRGEKATVGKSLYGMALSAPNPDFWTVIRPDMSQKQLIDSMRRAGMDPALISATSAAPTEAYVDPKTGIVRQRVNPLLARDDMALVVRIGGVDRVILFNKDNDRAVRLAMALKNLDSYAFQDGPAKGALAMIGMTTRWISAVNTQYNPIFGLKNFIRDVQGAAFNLATTPLAKDRTKVMAGVLPALKEVYADERGWSNQDPTWKKYWTEFQEDGATTGYRDQFNGLESRVKYLNSLVNPGVGQKALDKTGLSYILQTLSDYNTAIESGVRLSAYRAAREKGMTRAAAASLAKNLTVNFNRKGRSGAFAGSFYAFFNPAVQGNARILETAQGGHKGLAAAHYATKFLMAGASLGFVLSMLAMLGMGDDYEDIPEFIRERDIIIPIGKMDVEGAKTTKSGYKYLHIPMALGFHAIAGIGRTAAEMAYFQDKPGARTAKALGSLAEAFNPLGQSNTLLEMVAPSFMDPMIQLYGNQNAFGRPIAKQNFSEKDPTPAPDRFFRSASSVGKVVSKALDRVSGGDGIDPGRIQVTPDQVDFVFGQVTGGVGRESLKTYQWLESKVKDTKIPDSRVPLLGMFYDKTKSEQNTIGKFADLERAVNIAENQLAARESEAAREALKAEKPEAKMVNEVKSAVRRLNRLSKQRKKADARGDKAELDRIDSEANDIRSGVLDKYHEAKR